MNDITLKEAQQQVDQWINTVGVKYYNELTNLGILMEEVGELSRLMVRKYGEQSFKETDQGKNISDEMADVLWVLLCLANQTGVDLTEALAKNFETIAFDRPGHGLTPRGNKYSKSLNGQAKLLHDAMTMLGINRPILVGHSFGGTLAAPVGVTSSTLTPDE